MARKWRPTTAHEYFGQNIEDWSPTDTSYLTMPFHTNDIARVPSPALGVKVLEDSMASCQTALLTKHQSGLGLVSSLWDDYFLSACRL